MPAAKRVAEWARWLLMVCRGPVGSVNRVMMFRGLEGLLRNPVEALHDLRLFLNTVAVSTGDASVNRNNPNIAGDLSAAGDNGQSLFYPINAGGHGPVPTGRLSFALFGVAGGLALLDRVR